MLIGIDTGGTFTDLVAVDEGTGAVSVAKVSSTPEHPWRAVVDAVRESGVVPAEVSFLTLGTTVGTNALLERRGGRVLYVTTAGFEDIPFIQRIQREHLYDLQWQKPVPFCRREDCLGVAERIDAGGGIVQPLRDDGLEKLAAAIETRLASDPSASWTIAVNLLFCFVNPVHEEQIGAFLGQRFPDLPCSLSHRISPIWREYERGTTTCVDAFLKPIVAPFAVGAERELADAGVVAPLKLMKSNGGRVSAAAAAARPIDLVLSGLAGGLIAARHYARALDLENVISLDMGGTSADVGLVRDGEISFGTEFDIEFGLSVSTPIIDLHTVGAGGSSIAAIDPGGRLAVGPESAGARPGPACYAVGGTLATVTDANLVIGRLDPEYFLGGALRLDAGLATQSVAEIGAMTGLGVEATALAILDIAAENMANAIRMITVEKGLDVRDFALMAFGGAGPLHAAAVAESLGIETIVVPPAPGTVSAFGTVLAAPRVDRSWTRPSRAASVDIASVEDAFARLSSDALGELGREGVDQPAVTRSVSARYHGQNFEQEIALPDGPITADSIATVEHQFHQRHEALYGYSLREHPLELVHFNLTATGAARHVMPAAPDPQPREAQTRMESFRGHGSIATRVVARSSLRIGEVIDGPAIVDEHTSTTLIPPGYTADVSDGATMILRRKR